MRRKNEIRLWLTVCVLLASYAPSEGVAQDTVAAARDEVLAVGGTHACAVRADGVICWGDDRFGQLGDGVTLGRARSALVVTDVRFRSLAAGYAHTCGLDDDGQAYCWGANARGELGDGTFLDRATPVPVVGGSRFVALAAGPGLSCGVTAGGSVSCWGIGRRTPQAISSPHLFRAFASSLCGLAVDDAVYCWLYNWSSEASWGETGPARSSERFRIVREGYGVPRNAEPEWPFRDPNLAELGGQHACGMTRDDRLLCWIARVEHGFGRGSSVDPELVPLPSPPRAIAAGARHACALDAGGAVYCWGWKEEWNDRIGDYEEVQSDAAAVDTTLRFVTIDAYGERTCGVAEPGDAVYCWGGENTAPTPVVLSADERIRKVATELPIAVPRDTSEHWGFSLPQAFRLRFRGRASCERDAPRVREGPQEAPLVRIGFTSWLSSGDELWDDMGIGTVLLGGFRWRVAVGNANGLSPIAVEYISFARGRVFRGLGGCALTLEYEGEMRGERPDVLIDLFREIRFPAAVDSTSAEVNERGLARYRAGRHTEALTEFKRAVTLDDRNAEAANNAGFVFYRLGRLEESVTWYRRAIEIDPGRAVAYLNLGDSLEELGYHAEALGAYERYLELDPEGAAADRVRELLGGTSGRTRLR